MMVNACKNLVAVMLLIICSAVVGAAQQMTVGEYRALLAHVREDIGYILEDDHALPDPGETDEIKGELPQTLEVATQHGPVKVRNDWFHAALDAVDKEVDPQLRRTMLIDVNERLSAILWKAAELEEAQESGRSKDEEKGKLAEILAREQFQKPTEPEDGAFEALIAKILEWLDSFFPARGPSQPGIQGGTSFARVIQFALIALVVVLVGFGLFKLAPLVFRDPRRRKVTSEKGERVILGEKIGAGDSAGDLFADAEALARGGDIRAAIRKGYVALLLELNERQVIGIARHKTNRDYVRDVRERTELRDSMKRMTGMFERHWYGFGRPETSTWDAFRESYRSALKEAEQK